jgi:hypothetical protein
VVTTEHINLLRVPQLVREQQSDDLHIVGIPIDVVTLEEILFVWGWANLVEEPK